ncbi:putative alpha/Beta hydrolase [Rosa chinensis]|uniref:Putative alpha/Beta hydrolase n=1 Tax=Rosa chinensis TaxID=74649 RepID=A0A2P6QXK1_ROSCH|nr:putative alpha/Beta hydrolase [Rosa chinensis]
MCVLFVPVPLLARDQRKTEEMSGPQCCSNPPTLNTNKDPPAMLRSLVVSPPISQALLTPSLPLFLSLTFLIVYCRYDAPNLRKLTDKVAAAGFFVVVPDFFYGNPYVPPADGSHGGIPTWLKGHGPEKGFEDVKVVIEALKSKGVSAIGAAGFCWGAKVVVELAKGDFIQAAVLAHPSFVTVDDIKAVKVPISILGAEIDRSSPPELVKQFEEALTAKSEVKYPFIKVITPRPDRKEALPWYPVVIAILEFEMTVGIKSHVKIFPKVSHGWTVRYDVSDKEAVKPAEEAHKDLLEWFVSHVK